MKRIALLTVLLLAATAAAHTAAPPLSHEVRLLHDCNDDYFGGDALGNKQGHELHALDLFEAWDESLGNTAVFRLTFAGEGAGDIRLDLTAGSATKTFTWKTTGTSWTGTFDRVDGPFQAKTADGSDDGDRLVLHGIVKQSRLGDLGTKLTDYTVQSKVDGNDADAMPGYDGSITGSCADDFKRPDYRLQGPVQFATMELAEASVSMESGEETLVQLTIINKLRDQVQRVTITPGDSSGITVKMHNPSNDAYTDDLRIDLNKKGSAGDSKVAHIAITGIQSGAKGSVEVILTTDSGGRVVQTIEYSVASTQPQEPATPTTTQTPDEPPSEGAPAPGLIALVGTIAIAAWLRRP